MPLRLIFPIFLLLYFTSLNANEKTCSKDELLKRYNTSDKFQSAYQCLRANDQDCTLIGIKELQLEAKENNNKKLYIYSLFLEGEFLFSNSSFKQSLNAYQEVVTQNTFEEGLTFYSLISIGNIYLIDIKDFDRAISFYKKAEELVTNKDCADKKNLIYNSLGNSFILQEKYQDAEKYYRLELESHLENKKIQSTAISYNNIANVYYEQYQDEKAEEYFLKALETIKKKDSLNIRQLIYYNLSDVYNENSRYEEAYSYLTKSNDLKDSIWNRDKVWEIAEIEKNFDIKQKQQEVDLLLTETKLRKLQRNGLFISALILLVLLGIGLYFYKEKVKTSKIIASQKEDLDKLNATKDKLFSIVSHDLRSSVNALKKSNKTLLSTAVAKNDKEVSTLLQTNSTIVNGAYNLLDNLLNWALLQTKQSYFQIEEQRLYNIVEHVAYNYQGIMDDTNIHFSNDIPKGKKVLADQESLKIILRNLIDNAIKFSKDGDYIKAYINPSDDKFVHLVIEDSGVGMSTTTIDELLKDTQLLSKKEHDDSIGTGLGMQLCKSMIKKNKGKLSIESAIGKGTKMIVSLPQIPLNG